MELKEVISDSMLAKLKAKGVDETQLTEILAKYESLGQKFGHTGDDLKKYLQNVVSSSFTKFLCSNLTQMKAIVVGLQNPRDSNAMARAYAAKNKGTKRADGTIVQEGLFSWGNFKGKPIPTEPNWEQQGFIGIEYENKLYTLNATFSGFWVGDNTINKLKCGDVILVQVEPERLSQDSIFINGYKEHSVLSDDKYIALIENSLKDYVKTNKQIVDEQLNNTFVIMKGLVGEIEQGQNSNSFIITDNSIPFEELGEDVEKVITGVTPEVNFMEGAQDLVFLGNLYKATNKPGYVLNIYKTLVPEKYKKVELDNNAQETIAANSDELFDNIDSSVDLL